MPRSQLRRPFGFFLICPRLVGDSKTAIHQATMAKIELYAERLDDFPIKNCFVFPIMMAELGIKIQPCGSAKHQYVDRPGWEGFHCYVGVASLRFRHAAFNKLCFDRLLISFSSCSL